MNTLPGGDVASSPSAVGTIGFLGAGQTGEPMAERQLAAGHQVRLYARRQANAGEAAEIVAEITGERPFAEWAEILSQGKGRWSAAQNAWEVGQDPSLRANGLI